ncbi:hypothetical protein [Streptacidiphilus jiangxiensis]|uniref:DivIVA domain-containing protein n=1 Tax=Streptacidiphilus jiangxiensis TaxID=235985 RepID=A0A1H7HRV1_STRJI|nr:hypothetical protein [Streptacidiphilus jiangxiensis]SEK53086.1 hypothetical protein SAMN05414137_102332 [Streptacidiphilus jiangxiensis]
MVTSSEFRGFDVVRRGYERTQVDRYLRALSQTDAAVPAPAFDVAWRGYDRAQVDARVAELLGNRSTSG